VEYLRVEIVGRDIEKGEARSSEGEVMRQILVPGAKTSRLYVSCYEGFFTRCLSDPQIHLPFFDFDRPCHEATKTCSISDHYFFVSMLTTPTLLSAR